MGDMILDVVQAGLESTRGTLAAATRKVYATGRNMTLERSLAPRADATGTYQARRKSSYSRQRGGLSFTDVCTYEDLPWWWMLCLKNAATGVTTGSTPPGYTYTHLPTLATDDLKSATFEGIDSQVPYQWKQSMVNSWNLRWDSDSDSDPDWMLETELLTMTPVQAAVTPAIADRVVNPIVARGTKVYVDSATIGTTQLVGRAISGSISGNNNLSFRAYAEDETTFPANKVSRGIQTFDAQLVLGFSVDTEFAEFRATTPVAKKIRIERTGANIGSTPTTDYKVQLDLYGFWSSISFGERGNERTISLSLMGFLDVGIAGTFKSVITNAVGVALP